MLSIKSLSTGYGGARVLRGLDFALGAGECAIVVGPNGAGKTTLLRAVMQLVRTQGEIVFDGAALRGLAPEEIARAGIALAPQDGGFFPQMSVEDNLRVAAPRAQARARAYAFFPALAERRSQLAALLSGGERRMLVIARALALAPRLLLLDEASAGLAPRLAHDLFARIADWRAQDGFALLAVEQGPGLAALAGGRVYLMANGRLAPLAQATDDGALARLYFGV
ncbi:MAG: ATP-binding cassette domain-containing protein [Hyphomicrobiales bacterium]|nr:ATP-binding cassette domain-containing protein [Hyphomicrobiales bacterium]